MNKRILYLSYDGLTDPLGQSQILPYLLELEKDGFSFHIISFEKKSAFAEEEETVRELIRDKKIVWHPKPYTKHPPILSSVYDLWQMQNAASVLHQRIKFDIMWCRSYLPALTGLRLKQKFGLPFVFDMRGFWPDERVEGGSWNLKNPLYRAIYDYFKKKEKELLAYADHVVVLTQKAKNILQEGGLGGVVPAAISVVPCCVDLAHFDPERIDESDQQKKREELGIKSDNKVLVYAGSLGTWYLLREMLEYFKTLWIGDKRWLFLFITRDNPQPLWKYVTELQLPSESVRIKPVTRAEVPLYLSLGDLAISFIMPTFSKQASSPTKLAEYMAMGLPVVCNGGVGDVGFLAEKGLVRLIMLANFSKVFGVVASKEHIRNSARCFFSLDKGAVAYLEILGSKRVQASVEGGT